MTRLLSILSIACLGSSLAACSVSARVPVPFVGAVGSAGPETIESRETGGGPVEAGLDCHQELGADSGGEVEKAALIDFGAIEGCITDRDETDGFLIHIDDDMPLLVKLKSLNDHGSIHIEVFDVDGGKLGYESVGSFETKKLQVNVEAETDVFIRLKGFSHGDDQLGRYKLVVGPHRKVASR
jgi:hypothetical protein